MKPNVIKTIILLLDIISYRLFFVEGKTISFDNTWFESNYVFTRILNLKLNEKKSENHGKSNKRIVKTTNQKMKRKKRKFPNWKNKNA